MKFVPRGFRGFDGVDLGVERGADDSRGIDANAPLLDSAAEAAHQDRLDPVSKASDEKEETQSVRQQSRSDQEDGGDEDQDSVHDRSRGELASLHVLLSGTERSETLPPRQKRAQDSSERQEQERWRRPQAASELDQERELERRHENEQQEELSHGAIIDAMNHAGFAISIPLLLLAACDKSSDPSVIQKDARVTEVSVQILESFPVQARAVVRGELPDGCTSIGSIEQSREGNEFRVHIVSTRPAAAFCTQVLVLFEEVVALDVRGLKAGEYRVVANGVAATFRLEVDNG